MRILHAVKTAVFIRKPIKFLVLKRHHEGQGKHNIYWQNCGGAIEKNEKPLCAAKRELREETGISQVKKIKRLSLSHRFIVEHKNTKIYEIFYAAEINNQRIRISKEHTAYKWVSAPDAFRLFKWLSDKKIVKKTQALIRRKKL